ncbi:MAG: DUF4136 domain-containing protein [Inhella sp.]|uniref:DUF4136 domain-containing protein n=1 Tax=Inhella sp. TaxID=1921806 RepID=UPI00391C689D
MTRRALLLLAPAQLLAGCASLNQVGAEVSSFGEWPAGRAGGTYAFERLPSQQQAGSRAAQLEALAAPALAKAGFQPAPAGAAPDVIVAIGARVSRTDAAPWDDPLWVRWHAPLRAYRYGLYPVRPWGSSFPPEPRYDREVALLLRDRASGQALYEARASNDGATMGSEALVGALFQAAMSDFPRADPKPHWVRVPLP